MSVVVGEARSGRALACTDCRLLELDSETLEAMCVERPEIAIRIIQRLTTRLIESERRLSALGIDDLLRPHLRILPFTPEISVDVAVVHPRRRPPGLLARRFIDALGATLGNAAR